MTNDDLRAMRDEMATRAEQARGRLAQASDDAFRSGAQDIEEPTRREAPYRLLTDEQAYARLGLEHLDPRERAEIEAEHEAAMRATDAAYQENLTAA